MIKDQISQWFGQIWFLICASSPLHTPSQWSVPGWLQHGWDKQINLGCDIILFVTKVYSFQNSLLRFLPTYLTLGWPLLRRLPRSPEVPCTVSTSQVSIRAISDSCHFRQHPRPGWDLVWVLHSGPDSLLGPAVLSWHHVCHQSRLPLVEGGPGSQSCSPGRWSRDRHSAQGPQSAAPWCSGQIMSRWVWSN